MNLESKHAIAIMQFLDAIGYKKWAGEVDEVAVDVPSEVDEKTQLGTYNFEALANSIDYLEIPVPEVIEEIPLDNERKEIASLLLTISTPALN